MLKKYKGHDMITKGIIPTMKSIIYLFVIFLLCFSVTPVFAMEKDLSLKDKLIKYVKENEANGAGLATVIINGDETIKLMNGYADRENKITVKEHTVFEWGSISKVLIWISVFQLVEAGKLDLETDIKTYLPEDFLHKMTFDRKITLQYLMNHTAGFEDSYTDLFVNESSNPASLREVLEQTTIRQVFPPGEIVAYSNYGASLAAYIVSEVSGLDYRDYVRKYILEPLDMRQTAVDIIHEDNEWVKKQRKLTQGYAVDLSLIEPNYLIIPLYPSGSVIGTLTDLQKLLQALLHEAGAPLFQQENTIERFFETSLYFPETEIPRIANGLFFLPSNRGFVFGHGGNTIAFSSSLYVNRQDRLGVVVLTNVANETTYTLGIPELVFGKYEPTKTNESLESATKWAGIYESARASYTGFSKVYRLFLRSKAKQEDANNLVMNDLYYAQLESGIYLTDDDYSTYSIDVYVDHPAYKNVLSSTNSDLLYVPYAKHYFEWTSIVLFFLTILYSFIVFVSSLVKFVSKKRFIKLVALQHSLNLLLFTNIITICYQTFSMTTYAALKPFLISNLLYIFISIIIGILLILKRINEKGALLTKSLTALSIVILCVNIIYWEFYV